MFVLFVIVSVVRFWMRQFWDLVMEFCIIDHIEANVIGSLSPLLPYLISPPPLSPFNSFLYCTWLYSLSLSLSLSLSTCLSFCLPLPPLPPLSPLSSLPPLSLLGVGSSWRSLVILIKTIQTTSGMLKGISIPSVSIG